MTDQDKPDFDLKDGGWKSRKLWMTVIAQVLILGGGLATGFYPGIQAAYGTLVGGLVSCLALFLGGHVVGAHLTGLNFIKNSLNGSVEDSPAADSPSKSDSRPEVGKPSEE